MYFLTAEDIALIHLQIIDASGGSQGIRDNARVEASVAVQTQVVFGEELYKTLPEKAAVLCRGIIGGHPFVDGNKRTGIMSALILMEINGLKTDIAHQELEDIAVKIATQRLDVSAITKWLEAHPTGV